MKNSNNEIVNKPEAHKITIEGSLGLLAYGDIALRAWRKIKNKKIKKDTNE